MHHSIYFSIIFVFYFLLSPKLKNNKIIFFSLPHLPFDRNNSQITANHHTKQIQPTNHTLKYTNLGSDYTNPATSHRHTWYVQQLSNPIKHISSHNQTIHSHKFFTKSNPQPNKTWQLHGRWASPELSQVVAHSQQPPPPQTKNHTKSPPQASINCHQNPSPSSTQPL